MEVISQRCHCPSVLVIQPCDCLFVCPRTNLYTTYKCKCKHKYCTDTNIDSNTEVHYICPFAVVSVYLCVLYVCLSKNLPPPPPVPTETCDYVRPSIKVLRSACYLHPWSLIHSDHSLQANRTSINSSPSTFPRLHVHTYFISTCRNKIQTRKGRKTWMRAKYLSSKRNKTWVLFHRHWQCICWLWSNPWSSNGM